MPVVNYKTLHTQVGPFPKDHVFTREEFERLHPVPAGHANAKQYHDGLLDRLVNLNAVTTTNEPAMVPTPVGPANLDAKPAPAPAPGAAGTNPTPVIPPGGDTVAPAHSVVGGGNANETGASAPKGKK